MDWEIPWYPVLDPLQHFLVLNIVLQQSIVELLLNDSSTAVANSNSLNAESTADDWQYLHLLVTHIDDHS